MMVDETIGSAVQIVALPPTKICLLGGTWCRSEWWLGLGYEPIFVIPCKRYIIGGIVNCIVEPYVKIT